MLSFLSSLTLNALDCTFRKKRRCSTAFHFTFVARRVYSFFFFIALPTLLVRFCSHWIVYIYATPETTTMHEAKCYRIKDLFLIVHDWNILLSWGQNICCCTRAQRLSLLPGSKIFYPVVPQTEEAEEEGNSTRKSKKSVLMCANLII